MTSAVILAHAFVRRCSIEVPAAEEETCPLMKYAAVATSSV
jgi:hypothetical protein